MCFSIKDPAVPGDGDHLPGDELAAFPQSFFRGALEPAAAGYIHAQDGDALD